MKIIRVFVSSPGDVQAERTIADRLIRMTADEAGIPVSVQYSNLLRGDEPTTSVEASAESGDVILCPYFWEYQRFTAESGYQDQIPNTANFDLVVCILWSRLGTKLHPRFRKPDGSEAQSGTDYELSWAVAQRQKTPGVPTLHVYRNCSQPSPPLDPPEKLEEFLSQWKAAKAFFETWTKDSAGQFVGAFNNYHHLEEFERLFREHFRDFLSTQISGERQRQLISRTRTRRWQENPFRGLQTFDFEHAPIFHGRTKAVGSVLDALQAQVRAQRPFVLILGASGSGKSSLVKAGVLPLLIQPETIEGIGLWRRAVTRPGAGGADSDCFDALAAALLEPAALPILKDPESSNPIRDLTSDLREHSDTVALRVRDALDHVAREWKLQQIHVFEEREKELREAGRSDDADLARQRRDRLEVPKARLVLTVDQLEELFTSGFSADVRQQYIGAIARLVRSGRVFALATLRSDFYPAYQQHRDLTELVNPNGKVDLSPPTPYEIGNMIRLPAEAAGLQFEQHPVSGQRLDQALRDAASATPESLPLLEHVLGQLYELQRPRGDDVLRWSDYLALGELRGALAKHAEAVFNTLQPDQQNAFPLVMRYLVTLGQGEEEAPNRRTVPYRDFLVSDEGDPQKTGAKAFVDLFIKERLLLADTDPNGGATVCVSHEALLREWQRVKDWLIENRDFLRMRDRLDSSLKVWLSRGRQKDDLLGPGLPLAEGEKLSHDFESSLSNDEMEYIRTSVAERKKRRRSQDQIRYAVMAAMTVLALFAGVQWFRAERQRESAAQALKSEAELTLKLQEQLRQASWASFNQAERQFQLGEWREGVALLARGIKFDPTNEVAVERFFHELIIHREKALPTLIASFSHREVVAGAAFSPDGARILTASWDKTANVWDTTTGKLLVSLIHADAVNAAAFSPDGRQILTASSDGTAKLWDSETGNLITNFLHQGAVNYAAFSPDGSRIVTASVDKTAKVWEAASGKLIASFAHQSEVDYADFSPDGARVLTASTDRTAKVWEIASSSLITSFSHQGAVNQAHFSPDGARVLTASVDSTAKLWDATSGTLIVSFVHQGSVESAVFSPDGTRVLTASRDGTGKVWDAVTGRLIVSLPHKNGVWHAAFSPDGIRVLTAGFDKIAKLWDAVSGKLIASFNHQNEVYRVAFSPDGTRIITTSWDKTAKLWDTVSGESVCSFAHKDGLSRAVFGPDGNRALTASADKTAKLWDTASGSLIATFNHEDVVNDVAFSPDGSRALTASADKTAKLWEISSGRLIVSFTHDDLVGTAVFSPRADQVLTASKDNTAKLWDVATGKLIRSFEHDDVVNDAVFSPDGQRILTASADKTVRLWATMTGSPIFSLAHQDTVNCARFSPDGTRIVSASADQSAKVWSASTGQLIASLAHQDEVLYATFSSAGTRILTASLDKTAKLWDGASGKQITSFNQQADVYHGAFGADGSEILTAGADGRAKLWDAASGRLLASFEHQDTVRSAAFSPDGRRILTASWDRTAKLWDAVTPSELARLLKSSAAGNATSSRVRQIEVLAAVASGLQFSEDGSLVPVTEERRWQLTKELSASTQGADPESHFIGWFLSRTDDRTIFPASDVKIVDWVTNAVSSRANLTEEWLRNAIVFLPPHPLLHIALAASESDSIRAHFLGSFGVARLPNDCSYCVRASEMLLAQNRPDLALAAIDRALVADPADIEARALRAKILAASRP